MSNGSVRRFHFGNRIVHHGITGPTVGLLVAYLWTNLVGNGEWLFWKDVGAAGEGSIPGILTFVVMSAAFEIWKWIWRAGHRAGYADGVAESQAEAILMGRGEGEEKALTVVWRLAATDEQRSLVQAAASDLDINLPAVLGQPHITARGQAISPWDTLWKRMANLSAEVRERVDVQTFDRDFDRMLRIAAGVALDDLNRQLGEMRQVNPEGSESGD